MEDEAEDGERMREKRPRKGAEESSPEKGEPMDEDEAEAEDQVDDLAHVPRSSRGRKRDRAAAGSTIGDEDAAELEKAGRKKKRSKRKSEAASDAGAGRGRKRDHSGSDPELDEREVNVKRARSKKGRKSEDAMSLDSPSSITTEDLMVVKDPRCRGRRIGEEWEVNGQKFKVGPNGERLRLEVVMKERAKFLMVSRLLLKGCIGELTDDLACRFRPP
jgi:hypothetical protein